MSRHNKAKRLWHSAGSDRTGTLEKGNCINVWRIAGLWYPPWRFVIIVCILGLNPTLLFSDGVAVRHRERFGHGFLTFKNSEGKTLAVGEEIDTVQGDRLKTHLRFVFKDGSIYEETTLFSQSRTFRLISDHFGLEVFRGIGLRRMERIQRKPDFTFSKNCEFSAVLKRPDTKVVS